MTTIGVIIGGVGWLIVGIGATHFACVGENKASNIIIPIGCGACGVATILMLIGMCS